MATEPTISRLDTFPDIVGLDLSLRATGICRDTPRVISSMHTDLHRLLDLRRQILEEMGDDVGLAVVEGYSMGPQRGSGGVAQALGELGGVIRVALFEAGIWRVDVPPSSLKKFACGKGNANKLAVGQAATKVGYDGPADDNAVDAWWLRQMGLYRLRTAEVPVTAYRDDSIANVFWPDEVTTS